MNKYKKYFKISILITVVFVIISLFIPSEIKIERSIFINSSLPTVFHQIDSLKNWAHWSPWFKMDTLMKINYEGPKKGAGAKFSWISTKLGDGNLIITSSQFHDEIKIKVDFLGHGKLTGNFDLKEKNNLVSLTWSMETELGWNPFHKYFVFIMKNMFGNDLEKGLSKLKQFCENK